MWKVHGVLPVQQRCILPHHLIVLQRLQHGKEQIHLQYVWQCRCGSAWWVHGGCMVGAWWVHDGCAACVALLPLHSSIINACSNTVGACWRLMLHAQPPTVQRHSTWTQTAMLPLMHCSCLCSVTSRCLIGIQCLPTPAKARGVHVYCGCTDASAEQLLCTCSQIADCSIIWSHCHSCMQHSDRDDVYAHGQMTCMKPPLHATLHFSWVAAVEIVAHCVQDIGRQNVPHCQGKLFGSGILLTSHQSTFSASSNTLYSFLLLGFSFLHLLDATLHLYAA